MKDIAARANVSVVTVHKCIYGKPGVSEETRKRVLKLVEEMHYTASAMMPRREALRLAVVCPEMPVGQNSFFHDLYLGVQRAGAELEPKGVELFYYPCGNWSVQADILTDLARREALDGVAICCLDDAQMAIQFSALHNKGIPLITFNAEARYSHRLAHVGPPARDMGALAAELLCKMKDDHRRLLMVGGDKRMANLRANTAGFYDYIQTHHPELSLLEVNNAGNRDLAEELTKVLTSLDDVTGVYCSMTRNGKLVCETLRRLGLAHKIKLVCTDVFSDLQPYLEDGTVDATIWQDPRNQSYNAVMLLYHYLTTGRLREDYFSIRICPVMCSNYAYFL